MLILLVQPLYESLAFVLSTADQPSRTPIAIGAADKVKKDGAAVHGIGMILRTVNSLKILSYRPSGFWVLNMSIGIVVSMPAFR